MSQSSESEYFDPRTDEPRDDDDLDEFIVSDEEVAAAAPENEDEPLDRLKSMSTALKPNETFAQKVLKAHIAVLVSALGGPDHASAQTPPPYKLGHDALACLKDIKRWIKSVDEKTRTFDVALACADSGLVVNDLVVMLCQWDSQLSKREPLRNAKTLEKTMLADLELLVLLTWPAELTADSSEAQKLQFSNLRRSQLVYKKHILAYNKGQTLKAVLRLVLGTMAKDKLDREPRDNAILRLVLFFIRNILYISPIGSSVSKKRSAKAVTALDNLPANVALDDISTSTVLSCFKRNKVLMFLLTVTSLLGSDFDKEIFGPVSLECIHLLVKDVNPNDLLDPVRSLNERNNISQIQSDASALPKKSSTVGMQLQELLKEETKRKHIQSAHISTRHSRFGSLLSIQGDDRSYVVSGQEALHNANQTLEKLDQSKKWSKPTPFRYDSDDFVKSETVYLNLSAATILKEFVDKLLGGGCYNSLISAMSSLLTVADDLTLIDPQEKATYFLTIAWFFRYKRDRNNHYKRHKQMLADLKDDDDPIDFGSINDSLSQTNFILIISYFRASFITRQWSSVHVAMVCFLELLLISYDLFIQSPKSAPPSDDPEESQEEIDKKLGEGIIRNLFTSYDFLNVLVQLPQSASKHSPDYLKVCVHIVHILLKSFEAFTKEDVKLYIQKRRKKLKTEAKTASAMESRLEQRVDDLMDESDDNADAERAHEEKVERELDLSRTEARFFHVNTVSSYIDYLNEFEDLTAEEIKRCLSFFHRLFVVRKDYNGLYRLDFIQVLHRLRTFSPRSSSVRAHVDDFIYYFMKKFKTAFARFPNPIEILFPRIEEAEYRTFLSTGELYAKHSEANSQPRLAKDIEFIREFTIDEKVKILISALHTQEKKTFVLWLISAIDALIRQRLLDVSSGAQVLKPLVLSSPDNFRRLFINNPYIRTLFSMIGFDLPDIMEENCELPGTVPSEKLVEYFELIKKWNEKQPVEFEDGKDALYFVRSKEVYDDDFDYNSHYDENDESIAFETATNHASTLRSAYMRQLDELDQMEAAISGTHPAGLARPKKKRKERKHRGESNNDNRARKSEKLRRRRAADSLGIPEDDAPVKSSEFVNLSDDDSDVEKNDEFFEREEKLRQLLDKSGGIVNAKQLGEFKKVWSALQNSSDSSSQHVARVIEGVGADLDASESQETQSQELLGSQTAENEGTSHVTLENKSTQLLFSDSEDEGPPTNHTRINAFSDSDQDSEDSNTSENEGLSSNKENVTPPHSVLAKRSMISSDDDEEELSFMSATDGTSSRKRRLIVDDDDD